MSRRAAFNGKKTDISLTRTEHPDAQLPGPLLILDRVIRPGRGVHTYHRERSAGAVYPLCRSEAENQPVRRIAALISAYTAEIILAHAAFIRHNVRRKCGD